MDFAFIPVTSSQKILYNFKDLSSLFEECVKQVSKDIFNLKNKSEEEIQQIIIQNFKKSYSHIIKKADKPRGEKKKSTNYIRFCTAKRQEVKLANPGLLPHKITQELANLWQALSASQKEEWKSSRSSSQVKLPLASVSDDYFLTENEANKFETEDLKKYVLKYFDFFRSNISDELNKDTVMEYNRAELIELVTSF